MKKILKDSPKDNPQRFLMLDFLIIMSYQEDSEMREIAPLGFPQDLRLLTNPVFMILSVEYEEILDELMEYDCSDTIELSMHILESFS